MQTTIATAAKNKLRDLEGSKCCLITNDNREDSIDVCHVLRQATREELVSGMVVCSPLDLNNCISPTARQVRNSVGNEHAHIQY